MTQIVLPLAVGVLSVPLTDLYQCGVCVLTRPYFLVLKDAPRSCCVFPVPVLESTILQGFLVPFIKNQDLGTMCVH